MPSSCTIHLDRSNGVYFSGESITGKIQLRTNSPKKVLGVYICFRGEANVRFHDHDNTYYYGKEIYLESKKPVFGVGTMPAGVFEYNFCIPIPLVCPSTCNEKFGKTRYSLALIVERSYKSNNVFRKPIAIVQSFDLNNSPTYANPTTVKGSQSIGIWPFKKGAINVTMTLPKLGYVPQECMELQLHVQNQTEKSRKMICYLKIKQFYMLQSRTPGKRNHIINHTISKTSESWQSPSNRTHLLKIPMKIPPVPPSSHQDYIIKLTYEVQAEIDVGSFGNNMKLSLPFLIGTVPVMPHSAIGKKMSPSRYESMPEPVNQANTFSSSNDNDDFFGNVRDNDWETTNTMMSAFHFMKPSVFNHLDDKLLQETDDSTELKCSSGDNGQDFGFGGHRSDSHGGGGNCNSWFDSGSSGFDSGACGGFDSGGGGGDSGGGGGCDSGGGDSGGGGCDSGGGGCDSGGGGID